MDEAKTRISPEELEQVFDEGGDLFAYGDPRRSDRPGLRQRRVGVDLPLPMIDRLDVRAAAYGVTRQALIKTWLAERLAVEDRLDLLSKVGVAALKTRAKAAPGAPGGQTSEPQEQVPEEAHPQEAPREEPEGQPDQVEG